MRRGATPLRPKAENVRILARPLHTPPSYAAGARGNHGRSGMRRHASGGLLLLMALAGCDGGSVFGSTQVVAGGGAGRGTITGQVQADGGGLGGVTVLLANSDSTRTDAAGAFRFTNLESATYNLAVRVPLGYTPAAGETNLRTVIIPTTGGTQQVSFVLQRNTTGTTF